MANPQTSQWTPVRSSVKLHLRLSSYTRRVLDNDRSCFYSSEQNVSDSRLISDILERFYHYTSDFYTVESSISFACDTACGKLPPKVPHKAARNEMQNRLIRKARLRMQRFPPKPANQNTPGDDPRCQPLYINPSVSMLQFFGAAKKPDPTKEAFAIRESQITDGENVPVYTSFRDYLCTLLEEYAELPYSLRERIFFRELCEKIEHGVKIHDGQCLINVFWKDLFSPSGNGDEGRSGPYQVFPYSVSGAASYSSPILSDALLPYNYLVGFIYQGDDSFSLLTPASFRLSQISDVQIIPHKTAPKDLQRYKTTLERATRWGGVAYLSAATAALGSRIKAQIRLTPQGVQTFRQTLIDRPLCRLIDPHPENAPDGSETWELTGPQWQLERYLFPFGTEVCVLKPQELVDALTARHLQAAIAQNPALRDSLNLASLLAKDRPKVHAVLPLMDQKLSPLPKDGDPSTEEDRRMSEYDQIRCCNFASLTSEEDAGPWYPDIEDWAEIQGLRRSLKLSYQEARQKFLQALGTDAETYRAEKRTSPPEVWKDIRALQLEYKLSYKDARDLLARITSEDYDEQNSTQEEYEASLYLDGLHRLHRNNEQK